MRLLLIILLLVAPAWAAEHDLLEPDQAFRFSARTLGTDAVEVRYQIAPGYYLYREKFRFDVQPASVKMASWIGALMIGKPFHENTWAPPSWPMNSRPPSEGTTRSHVFAALRAPAASA